MAMLTIRNLDDRLKAKLRLQAARNGRAMEAEVRHILAQALSDEVNEDAPFGTRIHERFKQFQLKELPLPKRSAARAPLKLK
jgi:antitoxin FitA